MGRSKSFTELLNGPENLFPCPGRVVEWAPAGMAPLTVDPNHV